MESKNQMIYSEVIAKQLILPRKKLYTMADVNKVIISSLFSLDMKNSLTEKQAAFIVKCSAIKHDTNYSKSVANI